MQWLRSTIDAVVCSGEKTGAGAATDPSGSDGVTSTPEVAEGAVVENSAAEIAGEGEDMEAAGEAMIGKGFGTKLIGLDALPAWLRRL